MNQVLQGIRVLDFGRYIAGPYCAALLGQMGAEVIRIERPGGNEDRFLSPIAEDGSGALFMQMNAGKKGMTLNLAHESGKEILKRLIPTANVVVANMPDKALLALGLDYESLTVLNPHIILVSNSAFGRTGPYADLIGFDGLAQAMSGAAWFSGRDNEPVKAAVLYVDFSTALAAALGTVGALMARQTTGRGQHVETSLLQTGLSLTNGTMIEQAVTQKNRQPTGNRSQIVAPADLFPTQDGHIVIQVVGPYIFKRWVRLMGESWMLEDPRFKDDTARGENWELLHERTAQWCASRTTAEALEACKQGRVPAGPVLSFQEALDHPAVQAAEPFETLDYPGVNQTIPVAKPPYALSETAVGHQMRPPQVSEHTRPILEAIGYLKAQIDSFENDGVI